MYDPTQAVGTASAMCADDLESYRQAVEQHAIVAITDRRGRIVYANDLFCRISGFSRAELLGGTHRLVNSGFHPREFWRDLWTTIASGRVWHGEIRNRARDGSIYWVDSTIVPLRAADGRIRGYMAVRHPITELKRVRALQEDLARRDAFKESVLNSVSYAVVGTGPDSLITVFNRGAEELLGYPAAELIGRSSIEALCDPRDLRAYTEDLRRLRHEQGRAALESEWTYIRKDGSRVPVFVSVTAMRDSGGRFLGYLGVAHDISARRRTERALRESEQKFRALYQAAPIAIVRSSFADGRLLEANPAFHELTGYAAEDLPGLSLKDVSPPGPPEQDAKLLADLCRQGSYGPVERECIRKDGSRFQVLVNGMRSGASEGRGYVWSIAQDITRRKEMEAELRRAAHVDRLTGLANRLLLGKQLNRCIRTARRHPEFLFALLYIDLDNFKSINDGLGHGAGDRVLQEMGERLQLTLREEDMIARCTTLEAARLGGDEFVVLLDDITSAKDAAAVAARLIKALSAPYRLMGREFHLSASIGIVTSDRGHLTAEEYLRDADTAMYEAKRLGRGRFAVFDAQMRDRARRGLFIQNELRGGMREEQFSVVYQPLVCLETGRVRGCEALLRWQHPQMGPIPPSEFIPIAEDTGLIVELGDWVLRSSCLQFNDWRTRLGTLAPEFICVNISRTQLVLENFEHRVGEILHACGVEPRRVHLEITETAVMRDPQSALRVMKALRDLGISLALDDFGAGYSSLGSIHDFPIDVLKIDRSFLQSLGNGGRVSAVIEAVARLARQLSVDVVAEGIETQYQLELVRALGCHLGQGYYFGAPADSEHFARALPQDEPAHICRACAAA